MFYTIVKNVIGTTSVAITAFVAYKWWKTDERIHGLTHVRRKHGSGISGIVFSGPADIDAITNEWTVSDMTTIKGYGKSSLKDMAIKFFKEGYEGEDEKSNLETLGISQNGENRVCVPTLVAYHSKKDIMPHLRECCPQFALAMTPVGVSIRQHYADKSSKDLESDFRSFLVDTLYPVHTAARLVHRDVQPSNFIVVDGKLYLIDWAYATTSCGKKYLFPRTPRDDLCYFVLAAAAIGTRDRWNAYCSDPSGDHRISVLRRISEESCLQDAIMFASKAADNPSKDVYVRIADLLLGDSSDSESEH